MDKWSSCGPTLYSMCHACVVHDSESHMSLRDRAENKSLIYTHRIFHINIETSTFFPQHAVMLEHSSETDGTKISVWLRVEDKHVKINIDNYKCILAIYIFKINYISDC